MTDSRSLATAAGFGRRKYSRMLLNAMCSPAFRSTEQPTKEAALVVFDETMLPLLTQEPVDDVQVRLRNVGGLVHDGRRPLVRGEQDHLRLGNHAEERNAEQLENVLDGEHVALLHLGRRVPGQEQVRLDLLTTRLRALRLRRQEADHAV